MEYVSKFQSDFCRQATWHDLPDDIHVDILSRLDVMDLTNWLFLSHACREVGWRVLTRVAFPLGRVLLMPNATGVSGWPAGKGTLGYRFTGYTGTSISETGAGPSSDDRSLVLFGPSGPAIYSLPSNCAPTPFTISRPWDAIFSHWRGGHVARPQAQSPRHVAEAALRVTQVNALFARPDRFSFVEVETPTCDVVVAALNSSLDVVSSVQVCGRVVARTLLRDGRLAVLCWPGVGKPLGLQIVNIKTDTRSGQPIITSDHEPNLLPAVLNPVETAHLPTLYEETYTEQLDPSAGRPGLALWFLMDRYAVRFSQDDGASFDVMPVMIWGTPRAAFSRPNGQIVTVWQSNFGTWYVTCLSCMGAVRLYEGHTTPLGRPLAVWESRSRERDVTNVLTLLEDNENQLYVARFESCAESNHCHVSCSESSNLACAERVALTGCGSVEDMGHVTAVTMPRGLTCLTIQSQKAALMLWTTL